MWSILSYLSLSYLIFLFYHSIILSFYLSIYLPICLSVYSFVYSICLLEKLRSDHKCFFRAILGEQFHRISPRKSSWITACGRSRQAWTHGFQNMSAVVKECVFFWVSHWIVELVVWEALGLRHGTFFSGARFHIVTMATSNFCKGPIAHVLVKTGSVLCYAHASKWERQEYFNEVIPDEILEHLGWTLQCFFHLKTLPKFVSYFCCAKDMFQWGGRGKRTWLGQKMMRRTLDVDLGLAFCRPTRHRYITDITVVGSGKWSLGREPYGTAIFDAATKLWFQHVSTNTSTSVQGCLHLDWPIQVLLNMFQTNQIKMICA
jgi:hypothetical protein